MKKLQKSTLILLTLLLLILSVNAVNAVDNITIDSDSVVDRDIEVNREKLEIKFDDAEKKITFKVSDPTATTPLAKSAKYKRMVNDEVTGGGGYIINMENTMNYYKNGTHRLIITRDSPYRVMFNVTFNILNSKATSPNMTLQNKDTVHLRIENGKIIRKYTNGTLADGVNHLTEAHIVDLADDTSTVIFDVYYRGYMVGGVDQRAKTTLSAASNGDVFYIYNYDYRECYFIKEPTNVRLPEQQISWDGVYNYQYRTYVNVPTKVKEPVYTYKRVRKGYRWKHYKTRWIKKKFVTHKYGNGKWTTYSNRVDKIVDLLMNHKGKITKVVRSGVKKTVYVKYPLYYYKKVKRYVNKKVLAGYRTVTYNELKEVWSNKRGKASDIGTLSDHYSK